ncbi:hypothetical protein PPYR_13878 [Photinus pyralis]|uniref:Cytochrome P450 n=3 Tax=Photinus pyralis TaxID=7054 RepID=A0A1Y1KDJ5_PHOPY|nr:cytochrome P450 9e2-like isoform X2 [Photinus pyralis]KAB0794258.1 hypothetical protein PPYR_13878 [Photinus pyralis]
MGLLIVIALVAIAVFIFREIYKLQHWKRLSVPYDGGVPLFGNLAQAMLQKRAIALIQKDLYEKYSNHRYFGYFMFTCPSLVIRDLDLVKQICIRDFDHFTDHREFLPVDADPFWNKILFARKGRDWHDFRKLVAPAFTQSKMKQMFPYMTECADRLICSLPESKEVISMDIHDLFIKVANDLTLNLAYGINCNSFNDPNNQFYTMAKNEFVLSRIKGFKFFGAAISKPFANFFKVSFFSEESKKFYKKLMKETLAYRKKNDLVRVDVLHIMKEAQKGELHFEKEDAEDEKLFDPKNMNGLGNNHASKLRISDEDITVQLMGLFFSSFDSFTTYLCNCAYELTLNSDVQEKLIKEIDQTWTKCEGKITYESIINMKYFEMVCQETLRLRSPTVFLDRVVTKPYTIPPVLPHEKPLHLKKGQDITIPAFCFTRDEHYFENPEKFDPERFSDENKASILPQTMLTFGLGSRACMGSRMAVLQTKLVLFYFLLRYRLVPTEKTAIPFQIHKSSISQSSEHGYWLGLRQRTDSPHM